MNDELANARQATEGIVSAPINRPSAIDIAWNSWRDFAAANRPGRMTRFIGAVFGSQACRDYEHYERGFRERFIEVACRSGHRDMAAFRALVDRQVKVFDVPQDSGLKALTSQLVAPSLPHGGRKAPVEAEQLDRGRLKVVEASLLRICLVLAREAHRNWLEAHEDDPALAWRPAAEPSIALERLEQQLRSMHLSALETLNMEDLDRLYEEQLRELQKKDPPDREAVERSHDVAAELADRAFRLRCRKLLAEPEPPEPSKSEPSHRLPVPSVHPDPCGRAVEEPAVPATTVRSNPFRRTRGTPKLAKCPVQESPPVSVSVSTEKVFQGLDRLWRERI